MILLLFVTIRIPRVQSFFVGNTQRIIAHSTERRLFTENNILVRTNLSSSSSELTSLCDREDFHSAIKLMEHSLPNDDTKECYDMILNGLVKKQKTLQQHTIKHRGIGERIIYNPSINDDTIYLEQASTILNCLLDLGKNNSSFLPSAEDFNSVIEIWGNAAFVDNASVHCHNHLKSLWSLHDRLQDDKFLPLYDSYYHAIRVCSMRDRGPAAAQLAEDLMNEMESICHDHPHLTPDRSVANEVLNAWSKSGQKFRAGRKSEIFLESMIKRSEDDGKENMAPDITSFNIVLNALANGREKDAGVRAESLLRKMVVLSCPPDEISFNTVINAWARSSKKGAAERATEILEHMRKRYEAGLTNVQPSWSTYTTVLKAWARSRQKDSLDRAESVFEQYQKGCEAGKWSHNSLTYNSMINCYAKSNHPEAENRALDLFNKMKANSGKEGWDLCFVDIYTYTILIDTISKQESYDSSELAISLLEELEDSFKKTKDERLRPNVRVYTCVVNAVGRSHLCPNRAEEIVKRVEAKWENMPDVVLYNALINAYGWSTDITERSLKCFEILNHMIGLHQSGKVIDAKPDTVSFNSVLNACAYELADSQITSKEIVTTAVQTFELLCNSPEYGKPDSSTYIQVLITINNHLAKDDEMRVAMAEAIFLKCASNGQLCSLIITKLEAIIPNERFRKMMGSTLTSESPLRFDLSKFPSEWTANASRRNPATPLTKSRRQPNYFQVTKNIVSNTIKKRQSEHFDS